MRVVVQKSLQASVSIDGKIVGKIDNGYVLLVGFTNGDNIETIKKIVKKIITLRIFEDENNKMNYDIAKVSGQILSISQFTLYSKLDGRRPSFTEALNFKDANNLYNEFIKELRTYPIKVETGIFGSDMKVSLVNDGPTTIIIDSKEI